MIFYDKTYAPTNEKKEKKLYITFKILKIVSIILLIVSTAMSLWENMMWILTASLLAFVVVFTYIQYQYYNFYDVSFYEGELKVVKVRNNQKRILVTCFNAKIIDKIGIVSNTSIDFKDYKRLYATDKAVGNTIFITYNDGDDKALLLQYDEALLSALIKFYGTHKLEKQLLSYIKSR